MTSVKLLLILLGLVAALWLVNLAVTLRHRPPIALVTRGMYLCAFVAIGVNIWRMAKAGDGTMILANVIALICVFVAIRRSAGTPADEDAEETEAASREDS